MFDLIVWMSFFMEFKASCSCFLFSSSLFRRWVNVFIVFNMFALWLWRLLFSHFGQYQWTAEYFDRMGMSLTSRPAHVPWHQSRPPLHEIEFFFVFKYLDFTLRALLIGNRMDPTSISGRFWESARSSLSTGPLQVDKDSESYPVERCYFDFLVLHRAADDLFFD